MVFYKRLIFNTIAAGIIAHLFMEKSLNSAPFDTYYSLISLVLSSQSNQKSKLVHTMNRYILFCILKDVQICLNFYTTQNESDL